MESQIQTVPDSTTSTKDFEDNNEKYECLFRFFKTYMIRICKVCLDLIFENFIFKYYLYKVLYTDLALLNILNLLIASKKHIITEK